nr:RHS repeat-associated core domain-containing protein [Lysinibacillus timonensis]
MRFVWDGNTILHEFDSQNDLAELVSENLVTWVFNDGFVPSAKITSEGHYSIISDYLGTPVEAYDEEGNRVWSAELDVYGRVKEFTGEKDFIPFRYQGQYDDVEIRLYYNRFRYYDQEQGNYTQIDPIGLAGGNPTLYGYVGDSNSWIDPFGLNVSTGANRTHVTYQGIKNGLPYTGYASAPSHLSLTPNEIIAYRYGNNFDEFGGVAPRSVYSGEGVAGKHTARGLEQRLYEADVKAAGGDKTKVANKQNPVGPNNANRQSYLDSADQHLKANKICR